MAGAPLLPQIKGLCGGVGGAPSLSPDVALRGGRAGAGVLSEIGSSTSGSSLTGRAPAINVLLEECNRLLASEATKRQNFHACFACGMCSACYIIKTTRKAKCNTHAVLDCA